MPTVLFTVAAILSALIANIADSPEKTLVAIGSGIISALLAIAWK